MRVPLRLLGLSAVTLLLCPLALLGWLVTLAARATGARLGMIAMHLWARLSCRILGVRPSAQGRPPPGAHLFCANHLGYLDILVLAALFPTLFLSMAEVARWPLVGTLARATGTLFIDRARARDVARVARQMGYYLRRRLPITIFPEGRTSCGLAVQPFHSALLQVAVESGVPCVPVTLTYEAPGSLAPPAEVVCWWGEAGFAPHFARMLELPAIEARVSLGPPLAPGQDRKALARALEQQVGAAFVPVRQR